MTASRTLDERTRAEEQSQIVRLRRRSQALALFLVGALIAGAVAFQERGNARDLAASSQADSLAFAATAAVTENIELAALLAAEAWAASPDVESKGALLSVLNSEPRIAKVFVAPPLDCFYYPDSGPYVTVGRATPEGAFISLRNLENLEEVAKVKLVDDQGCGGTDPTGTWLIGVESGFLRIYDRETGEMIAERERTEDFAFSGQGRAHPTEPAVLWGGAPGTMVWATLPGLETIEIVEARDYSAFGAFVDISETGESYVIGSPEGTVVAYEASGRVTEMPPAEGRFLDPFVSDAAGLVGQIGTRGLLVAPLGEPELIEEIPLVGTPIGGAGEIPLSRDGTKVAIMTSEGLEVVNLMTRQTEGSPIEVDVSNAYVFYEDDGTLFSLAPAAWVRVDPDRVTATGRVVGPGPVPVFDVLPSPDGKSALGVSPEMVHHDVLSGSEAPVHWWNAPVGAISWSLSTDSVWFRLDLEQRVFERWHHDELIISMPLPPEVPEGFENYQDVNYNDGQLVGASIQTPPGPDQPDTMSLVFDTESGELLSIIRPDDGRIEHGSTRPLGDGLIAIFSDAKRVTVHAVDGQVDWGPVEIEQVYESLSYSPERGRYAIGRLDGGIELFDEQERNIGRLIGSASSPISLEFADGGDVLVSRHRDGDTLLWDTAEQKLIGKLYTTAGAQPYATKVSTDGQSVFHASPDGILELQLEPQVWFEAVCSLTSRDLTQAEMDAVVPGRVPRNPCSTMQDA